MEGENDDAPMDHLVGNVLCDQSGHRVCGRPGTPGAAWTSGSGEPADGNARDASDVPEPCAHRSGSR